MIPIKLTLRNFMCYRENVPPLSFDGIRVACLCGDNGNGKSALLDAMTWALWGEARGVERKNSDNLVHLGQREMKVEFEFVAGPNRYRVLRGWTRSSPTRKGGGHLELQLATEAGFKPITGNTMDETQQKITEILRMDYDTFINSAFLLQGRADEFTVKSPSKRKEILADILGLSFYDELEERARNYARERERDKKDLENDIKDIDDELVHREEYEIQLRGVMEAIAELEREAEKQEGRVDALRKQKNELDLKREQLAEVDRRIVQAEGELSYLMSQVSNQRRRVEDYEKVIAEGTAIRGGFHQLLEAKRENEELNNKLRALLNINERKARLEQLVEKAKGELVTEKRIGRSKIEQLEPKFNMLARFEEDLTEARRRLAEVVGWEEELLKKRRLSQELSSQISLLESRGAQLEEEIKTLEEKLDLLSQEEARCPLCETELGVEGRDRIVAKYEGERRVKADAYQANRHEIERRGKEHHSLEGEVINLEGRIKRERAAGEGRVVTLEGKISEASQAGVELAREKEHLYGVEECLAKGEFALSEQRELREVLNQLQELAYHPERHREVRQRLAELEGYEELHRRLEEAEGLIGRERESLVEAERAASTKQRDLSEDVQRREALSMELAALPELLSSLSNAQQVLEELLQRQRNGRDRLVELQTRLKDLASRERIRAEKEEALLQASREKGIYEELAAAFGKKGIQALIIETVLPEIEEEANRLLSRMTDNRMHIKMETQRAYKTRKGEEETLDINISDELGTRRYEMYSGGEAFRINFALRIALSKLLARRAGAPLPTLIIDEGFGTQDSGGREKLVEAINSIQDDFEKILVITHIEELKDAFPVRIEVTKTAEGSMIEVS